MTTTETHRQTLCAEALDEHSSKLLNMIRMSKDPDKAVKVVIQAILDYALQLQQPSTIPPILPLGTGETA